MTGVVQPVAGVVGAAAIIVVKPILPYALAFASAAMMFVIVRDMVCSCYLVLGFFHPWPMMLGPGLYGEWRWQ